VKELVVAGVIAAIWNIVLALSGKSNFSQLIQHPREMLVFLVLSSIASAVFAALGIILLQLLSPILSPSDIIKERTGNWQAFISTSLLIMVGGSLCGIMSALGLSGSWVVLTKDYSPSTLRWFRATILYAAIGASVFGWLMLVIRAVFA
jgi:hypothetical protein